MSEFILVVEFEVHEGDPGILIDAAGIEAAAALRDEPGCRAFEVLVDRQNDRKGLIIEVYADEAAYQDHRKTAHYDAFFAAIDGLGIEWRKTRCRRASTASHNTDALEKPLAFDKSDG